MTYEEKVEYFKIHPKFCECCGKELSYNYKNTFNKIQKIRFCSPACSNKHINKSKPVRAKIIGIYCIENIKNNKRYIGQSIDVRDRLKHHKYYIKSKKTKISKLLKELDMYTVDDFKFYVLEECKLEQLDNLEKYYISFYKSYIDKYGYNEDLGGKNNQIRSKSHSEKLSKTKKKQFEDTNSDFYKKYRIGQDNKIKPILQLDSEYNIVKTWNDGANEIISNFKGMTTAIIYSVVKKHNLKFNYYWFYKCDFEKLNITPDKAAV